MGNFKNDDFNLIVNGHVKGSLSSIEKKQRFLSSLLTFFVRLDDTLWDINFFL